MYLNALIFKGNGSRYLQKTDIYNSKREMLFSLID